MKSESLAACQNDIFRNFNAKGTSTAEEDVCSGLFGYCFNSHSSDVPAPPIFNCFIFNVYVFRMMLRWASYKNKIARVPSQLSSKANEKVDMMEQHKTLERQYVRRFAVFCIIYLSFQAINLTLSIWFNFDIQISE